MSLNLYTYCHNEPVMYFDPTGHWAIKTIGYSQKPSDNVKVLQKFLMDRGNNYGANAKAAMTWDEIGDGGYGKFGKLTSDAVKEFQKMKGLSRTGKVDTKTWQAMGLPQPKSPLYNWMLKTWNVRGKDSQGRTSSQQLTWAKGNYSREVSKPKVTETTAVYIPVKLSNGDWITSDNAECDELLQYYVNYVNPGTKQPVLEFDKWRKAVYGQSSWDKFWNFTWDRVFDFIPGSSVFSTMTGVDIRGNKVTVSNNDKIMAFVFLGMDLTPAGKIGKVAGIVSDLSKLENGVVKAAFRTVSNASKDIKVIGRLEDTAVARNWKGHDVLNDPNWTLVKNDEWVESGIRNKQEFYIASPMTQKNLISSNPKYPGETVFAREIRMLKEAGYVQKGDYFMPGK